MTNKKDFIVPIIFGIIALVLVISLKNTIIGIIQQKDFSSDIFTFASTLFGLILTAYAILFGVVPSMNKDFSKSKTVKDINSYFKICLLVLLANIISSLFLLFNQTYILYSINLVIIGLNIGFFVYIIFLINDIFKIIIED